MKVEVAVLGSRPYNKPMVSVDVKQHFNQIVGEGVSVAILLFVYLSNLFFSSLFLFPLSIFSIFPLNCYNYAVSLIFSCCLCPGSSSKIHFSPSSFLFFKRQPPPPRPPPPPPPHTPAARTGTSDAEIRTLWSDRNNHVSIIITIRASFNCRD